MIKKITLLVSTCMAAAFFSSAVMSETSQIAATKEVAPVYPTTALERRYTGWAVVKYSVNEQGRATNIEVTDSEPANVFDRAARKAISQSRFEVTTLDGEAVSVDEQYRKFVFEIDETIPGDLASRRR